MTNALTVQGYLKDPNVQKRVEELLKDKSRAATLTTSLVTIVNSNTALTNCKPETVLNAALTAASMNLPINPSLGMAAIVPYGKEAQFQIMWKGFIQLAQRSKQYRTISVTEVYQGQIDNADPLKGFTFNWKGRENDTVVGYAAYFELLNGFEKTLYMTKEEVDTHAKRFSKAYSSGRQSIWKDDFDAMARKTVLKRLIDQFGPKSTDLETALESDQAVINDTGRVYIDNLSEEQEAEHKAIEAIQNAKDEDELTDLVTNLPNDIQKKVADQATLRFNELSNDGSDTK